MNFIILPVAIVVVLLIGIGAYLMGRFDRDMR
jgi:hypothetical protein